MTFRPRSRSGWLVGALITPDCAIATAIQFDFVLT
jgi:hypothetical protein